MKKIFFKCFFIMIILGGVKSGEATVLSGPTCIVQAKIVDSGIEMRKSLGEDGQIKEYESKYVKFEIFKTEKSGLNGNCAFIRIGDFVKTDGGGPADVLKVGQIIEAGAELAAAQGLTGVVWFIQWEPIKFIDAKGAEPLSSYFILQSSWQNQEEKKSNEK